ncbi:hypothetical protein CAP48_19010 [Advenella sp. S44]|uniref:Bug family tripartite tricarboxylate transporter substrate binding protein n=1 Tax=Advenella sp. S44 TaxID=1982755 RepID=UPI000C298CCA|nr:tripartite tricarboxylate transporter substrate binding protein [Advenella sp. S44]PJX20491.1 hypothetical protein CAP48_19010 [Advenella sp. S44]
MFYKKKTDPNKTAVKYIPCATERTRRHLLIGGITLLGLAPLSVFAEAYPNRPISLIAGASSGGSVDIGARIVAKSLSDELGVPVIVENKPGATGVIGTRYVAKAPPDGYTLMFGGPSASIVGPQTQKTADSFDAVKEIVGINMVTKGPMAVAINPSLKVENFKALVELSKTRQVMLGVPGIGGAPDLMVKELNKFTGAKFETVPYKGLGAAINDAIGGQIDGVASDLGPFVPFLKGGRLNVLAVTSKERFAEFPDIPAVAESYSGFAVDSWLGIFAPAKTPPAVIDKVNAALVNVSNNSEVKAIFLQSASLTAPMKTPADFQKFVANEYNRWGDVLKEFNLLKN